MNKLTAFKFAAGLTVLAAGVFNEGYHIGAYIIMCFAFAFAIMVSSKA